MRKIKFVNCLQCGKEFKNIDSLQSSRPVCSQECLDARMQNRIAKYQVTRKANPKKNCAICNKPMSITDSLMGAKYICSNECKTEYKLRKPKKFGILSVDYHVAQGLSEQEAIIKVQQLQRNRSPRCIEYWQLKGYSEEESKQLVSQTQKKYCDANTMSKEERQRINHRSLNYWLATGLPLEEAKLQHKMFNDRSSLSYFVSKFGEELGLQAYQKECQKRRVVNSLQSYIDKYGDEEGLQVWQNKYKNRGPDSKLACEFFDQLYQRLPQYIKYQNIYYKGLTDKEFGARDDNRYYWYDFVISDIKFCIEFNGSYWHADPEIYKSGTVLNMFGKTRLVDEIWQYDKEKQQALEARGFVVKIVWCKDRVLPLEQIDILIDSIILRYKEYQNEKTQNR
jgi:endogenous inhibitor of DNA gyrase (YacG/DUF329 family)/G:T-mismatch repair DNA endonuclease (very short patch repair protein)